MRARIDLKNVAQGGNMKKEVEVVLVKNFMVEVDESKFTPEFMQGFNETIYEIEDIEGHIKNLAELATNGAFDPSFNDFVEGYGFLSEMGIKITEKMSDTSSSFEGP